MGGIGGGRFCPLPQVFSLPSAPPGTPLSVRQSLFGKCPLESNCLCGHAMCFGEQMDSSLLSACLFNTHYYTTLGMVSKSDLLPLAEHLKVHIKQTPALRNLA